MARFPVATLRSALRWMKPVICGGFLSLGLLSGLQADELDDQVQAIRQVDSAGRGHKVAIAASKTLSQTAMADHLPRLLAGLDGANPLAANWLRGAVEAVVDRELAAKHALPQPALEEFIQQKHHDPRARRLAYEIVRRVDPTVEDRLIPGMLKDPSTEFRRDAVARLLAQANQELSSGKQDAAKSVFSEALQGASDKDQVDAIVAPLEKLGQKIDVPAHFGFVMDWHFIGPFDNTDKKGFAVAYPPESEINLAGKYTGKEGEVAWTKHATADKYGTLNIAKELAPHKGAAIYAYNEFESATEQKVEIRLGTPNAWKLWVNGELLFAREEYHRGTAMDQYKVPASFKAGKNTLLLKVCQNEQTEEWAQDWVYQLRVCDPTGTAVLSATRPAPVPPKEPAPAADSETDSKADSK